MMKLGTLNGSEEEVGGLIENHGLKLEDFLEKPPPPLKTKFLMWPAAIFAIPLILLTLFCHYFSQTVLNLVYLLGFGSAMWLTASVHLKFKNGWATFVIAIGSVLMMLVASGVISPKEAAEFIKGIPNKGVPSHSEEISYKNRNQKLRSDKESAITTLAKTKKELNDLREQFAKVSNENQGLHDFKKRHLSLQKKLQESEKKRTKFQRELGNTLSRIKSTESNLQTLKNELKECQAERASQKIAFDETVEKMKAETLPQSPESKSVIELTNKEMWLSHNNAVRLASGHVLIMFKRSYPTDEIILTVGTKKIVHSVNEPGIRFDFDINNQKYFLDVLKKDLHKGILVVLTTEN